MEFGLAHGLAYRHDFHRDIAERQRNELLFRQTLNEAHANAKEYADALQVKNVMNPYDYGVVKNYAEGKIKEIGKFVSENPDYKYNPIKWGAYSNMTRELQDSEHIRRGTMVDNEFKAMDSFMKDMKNQEFMDTPEMHQNLLNWQNYTKTGSTDGITKNRKLFQFMLPTAHVDTEKIFQEAGSKLQHDEFGGYAGVGGYTSKVSNARRYQAAVNLLANAKTGRNIRYDFNNLDPTVRKQMYKDNVQEFAKQRLDPYVPKEERKVGYKPSARTGPGADGLTNSPYVDLYRDPNTQPSSGSLKVLLHTSGDTVYAGKGVLVPFTDQSGKTRFTKLDAVGDRFLNGTPITQKIVLPDGQLGIKVQYKIPIDEGHYAIGKELLDKGLIKNDNSISWPWESFWDDQDDLGEGNYASVVKQKDEKSGKEYYRVTAFTPVNHNETTKHEYDKEIIGQKDALYYQRSGQPDLRVYQDDSGRTFMIQGGQKVYGDYSEDMEE